VEAARAVTGSQKLRYSKMWVNVRRARRPTARVVKVLRPGEPVLVDSLSEGWYRVVADGEGVGYVYGRFVDTVPPAGLP
jgi:SH3-like domain-containing protein